MQGCGDPGSRSIPGSVLFCCDHNAIRSPMAEGMMKQFYGRRAYVQSAGVHSGMEVNGFAAAVCAEMGIDLSRHQARSFDEMREWGDDLAAFDLIVALSPASQRQALELTRLHHLEIEYWPIMDPSGLGRTREDQLDAFRQTRDQIHARMIARFGPPTEAQDAPQGTPSPT